MPDVACASSNKLIPKAIVASIIGRDGSFGSSQYGLQIKPCSEVAAFGDSTAHAAIVIAHRIIIVVFMSHLSFWAWCPWRPDRTRIRPSPTWAVGAVATSAGRCRSDD